MMKIAIFIISLLLGTALCDGPAPKNCDFIKEKPSTCTCLESIDQLFCTEVPTSEKKSIEMKDEHTFKKITFQLKTLANLQPFSEKHYEKLFAETLVVEIQAPTADDAAAENLRELVHIVKDRFELKVQGTTTPKLALNLDNLPDSLTWLSLDNVQVSEINLNDNPKFPKLNHLELIKTDIQPAIAGQFQINMNNLDRLTLNKVTGLGSIVAIQNKECQADSARRYIEFRDNTGTTDFIFNFLLSAKNCKYHIDLSGSTGLPETLLKSQIGVLNAITRGQLYLVMHNVPQVCTICLRQLAVDATTKSGGYFHSIQCSDKEVKATANKVMKDRYLAEIPLADPGNYPDFGKVELALKDGDDRACNAIH